jgi:ATP-dependent RNA helicase RhlE
MKTQSFADLGVTPAVVSSLSKQGITSPFAIQQVVIGDVLAGRDVLAKSPTGSGKTLAFGIPMVQRIAADGPRPAALVLAPTRELATQIVDDIRDIAHTRALRVAAVYGGVGLVKQAQIAARSHILVATPGRLEDLLARGAFSLDQVQILVLDEADRMLDMGFRPAVDRIVAVCRPKRQTLFFSATLDGEAGVIARRYTSDAVVHEHGPSARRAAVDIEHRFLEVAEEHRVEALVRELARERDLTLVFVRTKHGADRLVKRLGRHGVNAVAMHGNRSQRQREVALARFESGAVDVLVATDVAARGIDVKGISHVINFDPPADGDTYVHRIGRTGRAGSNGVGITLVAAGQRRDVGQIARELGLAHGLGGGAVAGNGGPPRRNRPASRPGAGNPNRPATHAGSANPRSHRRRSRPRVAGRS